VGSEAGAPPPGAWPWTPSETKTVKVSVLTAEGVAVKGVDVTFKIVAGEGGFDVGGFLLANTTTVKTDKRGLARVRFIFDEHTGPVPGGEDNDAVSFYTQLEPGDLYATRVGANLIRVTTAPHMLAGRASVTAVDEVGNPIANAVVNATLNPVDGAVLTYEELMELTAGDVGTLLLEDFDPPPTVINDELTRSDGKMVYYVIVGDSDPTVLDLNVTKGEEVKEAHPAFIVEEVEEDSILFAWSGRPVGSLGTQLIPVAQPETGSLWKTGLRLGDTPGQCSIVGTIEEFQDGGWTDVLTTFPSPTVWAVEMVLVTPFDSVVVGTENSPVEQEHYRYAVYPLDYVPEKTALVFSSGGKVTGAAQIAGRGQGLVTLEPGTIILDPTEGCTVQPVVNPGIVWGVGTSAAVDLEVKFEEYSLSVLRVQISTIKGLYTESGEFRDGYVGRDNRGRVYCNRVYDPEEPSENIWTKNTQYVDVEVRIEGEDIPSNARIVWEFDDPDDPSNENPRVSSSAGKVLDSNDYDHIDNDGDGTIDNSDGNDNRGGLDGFLPWEGLCPDFCLTEENETQIVNGKSRVRFHVTDVGGDNFKIRVGLRFGQEPPIEVDQSGVFTVWKQINLEYVKMETAPGFQVVDIQRYFDMAFVQFDIEPMPPVPDGLVDVGSPQAPNWVMGNDEEEAGRNLSKFISSSTGVFSNQGPGWFLLASVHGYTNVNNRLRTLEFNAKIKGNSYIDLELDKPLVFDSNVGSVYIFNSNRSKSVRFDVKDSFPDGYLYIFKKEYFPADDILSSPIYSAGLLDYGFPAQSEWFVKVVEMGDGVTIGYTPVDGISLIFHYNALTSEDLLTAVHELTHAFGLAHLCGNWSFESGTPRKSCSMNYDDQYILDDETPRRPIPWTNDMLGIALCAAHIRALRRTHLEDRAGLGWE